MAPKDGEARERFRRCGMTSCLCSVYGNGNLLLVRVDRNDRRSVCTVGSVWAEEVAVVPEVVTGDFAAGRQFRDASPWVD